MSLCGTLVAVKFIKSFRTNEEDNGAVLLEEALKGKKAVSMLFNISELPVELLYPGAKVDVIDRTGTDVESLVDDITVVGVSYLPEREQAKVFVAVSQDQSMKILGAEGKKLGIVVVGSADYPSDDDDIEIIEF